MRVAVVLILRWGPLSSEEALDEVSREGVDGAGDEEHEEETAAAAEDAPAVVAADHEAAGLPRVAEPGERRVRPAVRSTMQVWLEVEVV